MAEQQRRSVEDLQDQYVEAEEDNPSTNHRLQICSIRSKRGELCGDTWTGSCVEIPTEGSATWRQSRTLEETGLYRDGIIGGFDAWV